MQPEERTRGMAVWGLEPPLLASKMEEGDQEPKNAGGVYKLEKAKKQILLQNLQKGRHSPAGAGF